MSTPVELEDGQHELAGILIGRGTPVVIAAIEGLGRAPQRTADVEPPGEDGLWLGPDLFNGRTIRIDARIKLPGDQEGALNVHEQLQNAADDESVRLAGGATTDLRLKFVGRPARTVRGRIRALNPDLTQAKHGLIPLDIEFTGQDHLFYDEQQTTSMPLGSLTQGGLTFPLMFPFTIEYTAGAVGRPGFIDVGGTAGTWPVLRITGPCANPTIKHVGSGRTLTVQGSIADGDWVEIDTRPGWRTVLRSNGGGMPLTAQSRIDLFRLDPGLNEIHWNATDPTLTSSLAVTWWPAYKAL
ncbi:phage distal tail protein [Streptomyces sp. NPDC058985]|uniref:phage distal tail protein n=1 Tax=Streptomyces sp. NPDC058985 TaxID=3346684 RepID=UPI00367F4E5A